MCGRIPLLINLVLDYCLLGVFFFFFNYKLNFTIVSPALAGGFFTVSTTWEAFSLHEVSKTVKLIEAESRKVVARGRGKREMGGCCSIGAKYELHEMNKC